MCYCNSGRTRIHITNIIIICNFPCYAFLLTNKIGLLIEGYVHVQSNLAHFTSTALNWTKTVLRTLKYKKHAPVRLLTKCVCS